MDPCDVGRSLIQKLTLLTRQPPGQSVFMLWPRFLEHVDHFALTPLLVISIPWVVACGANQQPHDVVTQVFHIYKIGVFAAHLSNYYTSHSQYTTVFLPCIISGTFHRHQLKSGHRAGSGTLLWPTNGVFAVAMPTAFLTKSSSRVFGAVLVSAFLW